MSLPTRASIVRRWMFWAEFELWRRTGADPYTSWFKAQHAVNHVL